MSIVFSDGDTTLEIVVEKVVSDSPASAIGSFDVSAIIQNLDFKYSGAIDTNIDARSWGDFVQQLRDLDEKRVGTASISSNGFSITIISIDSVGNLAVGGSFDVGIFAIQFKPFNFNPTDFSKIVRRLSCG